MIKIAPSEAWKMTLPEIIYLTKDDAKVKHEIDTSIMLHYERMKNGAPRKWQTND